jgi:DNA polymerase-1
VEVFGGSSKLSQIAYAGAHTHTHVREGEGSGGPCTPPGPSAVIAPFVGFDIETADADDLFRWPRGGTGEDGTGFVRLSGVIGPGGNRVLLDKAPDLVAILDHAGRIDGHNILGFDGPALAHHHGLDIHKLAARAFDTELTARQAKPPRSRESGTSRDRYGLDVVAGELGLPGKTDELPRLARKHGGYDRIPVTDPEYRDYLMGDLAATAGVASQLLPWNTTPYVRREHRVAAIGAQMTLNGFAVDQDLLARRYAGEQARKREAQRQLHEEFGLPLSRVVLKGRAPHKREETETFESPLATSEGRAWLEQAFASVPDPPRTPKSGDIATGADELAAVAARPDCPDWLHRMIGLMATATGARTVYQTATTWLCPDGRVHPRNSFRQASGRWSVLNPGMTVFGKHDGRHIERDVFTADAPGWVTVSFDLAQVDMRAIAGHSGDPEYIKLFLPGRDAHAEIAIRVYGSAKQRQNAKVRGHGWNYGMGPERMIRDGIDPAMAYGFDHGMKESFPVMCSWREQVRALGKAGYILDNGFGRRMRCEPKWAHTVAPALMGQGGARDIMCECLLRLPAWTWPYLRAMVHDEVVMCVPLELLRDLVVTVTQAMTWTWHGPGGSVPILCDINGPGWSWGDINAKCAACGATHGPGYCDLHAELKRLAARHELEAAA